MSGHKNILFGICWFTGGVVLTAIDESSLYWGAIVAGAIQFIVGGFQVSKEAEHESKIDKLAVIRPPNEVSSFVPPDAFDELGISPQKRILVEALVAVGFVIEGAEYLDDKYSIVRSEYFAAFNAALEKIAINNLNLHDALSLYTSGTADKQFKYIKQKLASTNFNNNDVFANILIKSAYFISLSGSNAGEKAESLINQYADYFNISYSQLIELRAEAVMATRGGD